LLTISKGEIMNEIPITLVGTAVQDVRTSVTRTGTQVSSFRMACNSRRFDKASNAWVDGDTTYLTVNCWRSLADSVAESVHRGDPLLVTGRLKIREWSTTEKSGLSVEVEATSVGHDMSRGTSMFTKRRRDIGDNGDSNEGGDPWSNADVDALASLAKAAKVDLSEIPDDLISVAS
jgi:single-strand DNA-binding protein